MYQPTIPNAYISQYCFGLVWCIEINSHSGYTLYYFLLFINHVSQVIECIVIINHENVKRLSEKNASVIRRDHNVHYASSPDNNLNESTSCTFLMNTNLWMHIRYLWLNYILEFGLITTLSFRQIAIFWMSRILKTLE